MKKSTYIIFVLLFGFNSIFAQKVVKGIPELFKRPKDVFDNPEAIRKMVNNTTNKTKEAWLVISDRDNNPVYQEMDASSSIVRELNFRDKFYVVEDKEDWILIADAPNLNKLKSKSISKIGWIPKDKILLWNSGLKDERTDIDKKAFLLNRADDVSKVLEDKTKFKDLIVDFYRDPTAQKKDVERNIYDYFFVFKKENGMLLLAEDSELSSYNIESKLLGWVDQRKVQEWNTRICLEPNFTTVGFEERRGNENLRLKAFGDDSNVANFINNGSSEGLFFSTDPTNVSSDFLAKKNPRRYLGNLVRYPMFKKGKYDGVDFYKSGIIGNIKIFDDANGQVGNSSSGKEMGETEWALLKQKSSELSYRAKNVNIFFLIEGTDKTAAQKENIIQAMKSLRSHPDLIKSTTINYGALVYKDVPETGRITQFERLNPDLDKVTDFVNSVDFRDQSDQDDYTAFYFALKKGLQVAGFDDSKTNIIVVIGAGGDFSKDPSRKSSASNSNNEALVSNDEKGAILRNLAELDAHLFSIQLINDGFRPTRDFSLASQKLILEGAKYIYNKVSNNSSLRRVLPGDIRAVVPEMQSPIGQTKVNLQGSKPGTLVLPVAQQSLTGSSIQKELSEMVIKSIKYQTTLEEYFRVNIGQGRDESVNSIASKNGIKKSDFDLQNAIANELNDVLKQSGGRFNIPPEGIKLSLYTEVYCPVKMKNANYNLFSFVLFMPEEDLLTYHNVISRGISSANLGSYPDKRKSLRIIYLNLIEKYSGQEIARGKKPDDYSREEVMALMQGIQDEGLELDVDLNVRIGSLRNSKEVSDEQVDQLIKRFNDVSAELERIIKLADRYEFCMVSDNANRYYWLTMDQVF